VKLSAIIPLVFVVLSQTPVFGQTPLADSLQQVVLHHPHDTTGIKALVLLASEAGRQDLGRVKTCAFQALQIAKSLKTQFGLSGIYTHLTNYYSNSGMPDSARYYLYQMKLLQEEHPEDKNIGGNYHLTAGLFYKNKGEYEEALSHMLKALTFMNTPEYHPTKAGQLLNIGNTYSHLGELQKAAAYHLEALRQFELLGNRRGQSFCFQSLGNDYLKLRHFSASKKYYLQSLALKEELKDLRGRIPAWIGLGSVYTELGQFSKAQQYYEQSLRQARELKIQLEEANTLYDLGMLQVKMQKQAEAKLTFLAGLPLARQRGDSLMSAKFSTQLAILAQDSLKARTVEKVLLTKVQASRRAGDKEAEADAYLRLSVWNSKNGQSGQAYALLQKYHQLRDSMLGNQVLLQLKTLEARYHQEKNEQEILLLRKDQDLKKAIIARQSAQQKVILIVSLSLLIIAFLLLLYLRTVNRTRRTIAIERVRNSIARDLHDDIGSALSSIQINSQLAMHDGIRNELHLQRISESASRMLESMSDIVWSISPENDTLEKMLVKMREFAAEILEPRNIGYQFRLSEQLGKVRLSVEARKNLYLIFKESINNAAKYSEGSLVEITLALQNNSLHLCVRDNGKGFEASAVRQGNGLLNMAERARNLNGRLTRESVPGKGTEIIAELPIT
jgi:signal transduction histidine kinase